MRQASRFFAAIWLGGAMAIEVGTGLILVGGLFGTVVH